MNENGLERFLEAQEGDYEDALDVFYCGKRDELTIGLLRKGNAE